MDFAQGNVPMFGQATAQASPPSSLVFVSSSRCSLMKTAIFSNAFDHGEGVPYPSSRPLAAASRRTLRDPSE